MARFKVGQKVLLVKSDRWVKSEDRVTECEVIKVGRKYVYVNAGSVWRHDKDRYSLETGYEDAGAFVGNHRIVEPEVYALENEAREAESELDKTFNVKLTYGHRWAPQEQIALLVAVRKIKEGAK